ncbi:MAG: GWxTD domain-containing protein [bacterium]|nr:MAG: GWxTD domain-containing protein [bacterium]
MKNIYIQSIMIFIILIAATVGNLGAQKRQESDLRPFNYDVVVFPGNESQKATVDIYVWVGNTHLQYIRMDTLYSARYQINFEIYKNENIALLTRDTTLTLTENTYPATIDPNVQRVHHFQYNMSPNKYLFKVRLLDLNSGRSRVQEIERNVNAIALEELGLSDILLLDKNDLNTVTANNIIPRFRVPIQEKIYIYTEVLTPDGVNNFDIKAFLSQKGETKRFTLSNTMKSTPPRTVVLLELTKENMIRGQNQLRLVVSAGQQFTEKIKTIRFIQPSDSGALFTSASIDEMVSQLNYVARGDEWKNLRDAIGEDRERLFKEFWEKRDPTPGTEGNELYDEYYKRVSTADQRFRTAKRAGWKSDRGRVYIIFGPPDNIEKYSPSRGSFTSYEVWYYDELRKKFVFLDEFGFGDYRLVSGNL